MMYPESVLDNIENMVWKFNTISGSLVGEITYDKLKLQANLIKEELEETFEAIDTFDEKEIVDGVCDILVTAFGLAQMLESRGHHVYGALQEICENNLTKMPPSRSLGELEFDKLNEQGYDITFNLFGNEHYVVLKDENGKVRKPYFYERPNIDKYINSNKQEAV